MRRDQNRAEAGRSETDFRFYRYGRSLQYSFPTVLRSEHSVRVHAGPDVACAARASGKNKTKKSNKNSNSITTPRSRHPKSEPISHDIVIREMFTDRNTGQTPWGPRTPLCGYLGRLIAAQRKTVDFVIVSRRKQHNYNLYHTRTYFF